MSDHEIRKSLRAKLLAEHAGDPDTLVIDEFGCRGARIDIAVVNSKLHGFEIKSEFDTLERLATQVPAYNAVFDRMTAVVAPKHLSGAVDQIPPWWEVMTVSGHQGGLRLRKVRRGKANPSQDAFTLARMLWRREALSVLRQRDLADGLGRAPALMLSRTIADRIPVREIAQEVRAAIKARGGSGFERLRTRNGDSCTTESTAAHYRKNLDWLLSLQPLDHQH